LQQEAHLVGRAGRVDGGAPLGGPGQPLEVSMRELDLTKYDKKANYVPFSGMTNAIRYK
jgi:hypothetical protein